MTQNPMRANVILIFLCGGLVLAIFGQWRSLSQVRAENRTLIDEGLCTETVKAENRRLTDQVAHNEIEAQTLRDETVALQSEAQRLREEVVSLRAAVHRSPDASAHVPAVGKFPSSPSSTLSMPSLDQARLYHMRPEVFTNLAPLSAGDLGPDRNYFFLDDVELTSGLSKQSILSGPDWTPSEALPLGLGDAEQIARAQLRTIVQDEPSWVVRGFSLLRLAEPSLQGSSKWQYSVMLAPRPDSNPITSAGNINTFIAHMSLSGDVGPVGVRGEQ